MVSAQQFQAAEGTADWRALARGASAFFRAGSARQGAELVGRVALVADEADHHPDLDLRRDGVVARVFTHSEWALTDADLGLARSISASAAELGLAPEPAAVQDVDLTIDALDIPAVRPFWAAVLGHDPVGEEDLLDPQWRWPAIWFQQMDAARPLRNRIHLDTFWPRGLRAARVDAALGAGGRVANDAFAPNWWTLADAEGNEVDVNDWEGFPYEVEPSWLTPAEFAAADGVDDWAFLQGATALYRTQPGLAQGAQLASTAAALADEAGLPTYADLRYGLVTLRVAPPEDGWMDDRGLALCRSIQVAARDLGLSADPRVARDMHVVIDALDVPAVRDFWAARPAWASVVSRIETWISCISASSARIRVCSSERSSTSSASTALPRSSLDFTRCLSASIWSVAAGLAAVRSSSRSASCIAPDARIRSFWSATPLSPSLEDAAASESAAARFLVCSFSNFRNSGLAIAFSVSSIRATSRSSSPFSDSSAFSSLATAAAAVDLRCVCASAR